MAVEWWSRLDGHSKRWRHWSSVLQTILKWHQTPQHTLGVKVLCKCKSEYITVTLLSTSLSYFSFIIYMSEDDFFLHNAFLTLQNHLHRFWEEASALQTGRSSAPPQFPSYHMALVCQGWSSMEPLWNTSKSLQFMNNACLTKEGL